MLALCFGLTFHAKYTTLALLPLLLLLPFEQKPRKGKRRFRPPRSAGACWRYAWPRALSYMRC